MALTLAGTPAINGLTLPTDTFVSGMVLVNKTDFTAASSVSVNNCFTSAYENYRVMATLTAASANGAVNLRLRSSGTDSSGSNYYYGGWDCAFGGALYARTASASTYYNLGDVDTSQPYLWMSVLDVLKPQLVDRTIGSLQSLLLAAGTGYGRGYNHFHNLATSYDGFTIYPASGTITGTVRVYGMRNA